MSESCLMAELRIIASSLTGALRKEAALSQCPTER